MKRPTIMMIITTLIHLITTGTHGQELVTGTAWLKDGDSFYIYPGGDKSKRIEIRALGFNTPEWSNAWGKMTKV